MNTRKNERWHRWWNKLSDQRRAEIARSKRDKAAQRRQNRTPAQIAEAKAKVAERQRLKYLENPDGMFSAGRLFTAIVDQQGLTVDSERFFLHAIWLTKHPDIVQWIADPEVHHHIKTLCVHLNKLKYRKEEIAAEIPECVQSGMWVKAKFTEQPSRMWRRPQPGLREPVLLDRRNHLLRMKRMDPAFNAAYLAKRKILDTRTRQRMRERGQKRHKTTHCPTMVLAEDEPVFIEEVDSDEDPFAIEVDV